MTTTFLSNVFWYKCTVPNKKEKTFMNRRTYKNKKILLDRIFLLLHIFYSLIYSFAQNYGNW